MGQRFTITESDKNQIRGLHSKQLIKETTEVDNMIKSGVIDNDIVVLPPNSLFDTNVHGSLHFYKLIRSGLFKSNDEHPVAYYKITDTNIIETIKNSKYNKGNGKPIRFGHWHFSKANPNMIELFAEGTEAPRKGILGKIADVFSEGEVVVGTIPAPKGVLNKGALQYGLSWFWDNSFTNIFFEFRIAHEQVDAYGKLMEQVIKTDNLETQQPMKEPLNERSGEFQRNVVTTIWSHLSDLAYADDKQRKLIADFVKTLTSKFIPMDETISDAKLTASWQALANGDYKAASEALDYTEDDVVDYEVSDDNIDEKPSGLDRETPPHAQDAEDSWFGDTNNDDYMLDDDNSSEYDDLRSESIEKIKKQFQRFL